MFQLNPSLYDFWRTRKPYKLLKGGRFSSKTQDAGGMAAFLARNYRVRIMCIRQFQNRIADSVYTVVKEKIEAAGWQDEFDIGVSTIRHKVTGSEFLFYGIARNLKDIKGTEGVDILWIEEGEGLTEEQWSVIDPTIRKEGAEIWVLWNPDLVTDFVQAKLPLLLGDKCIIRHINYTENPFLSDTAREKAERLKEVDPEAYRHIYLGVPYDSDSGAVIKRTWVQSAIDAHLVVDANWTGRKCIGYDVADDGEDKNANAGMDGSVICLLDEWKGGEDELRESAARSKQNAERIGADVIGYDSIGVGAGTGSHLNAMDWRRHFKFNAAGKVERPEKNYGDSKIKNKDFFSNLKAQAWWMLADRFRNTHLAVTKGLEFSPDEMISIDSSRIDSRLLEQLAIELATPLRDYDNQGKVKVESKKDLAKRDIRSPNLADSVVIAASRGMLARVSITEML
ncbi:PBSX family phage terminase large subunit [Achromobacter sp. Marseille-Q0513]|uniref:PBSX family phage terminase large subunit n=1 Tax=Achromobacter sp. Marseille-Q0513 TaxID=2829161 RepID=UPI001B9FE407|nr:PBSX family phage terminase large subunit [Achromobacter sp. Marseille-Q0513]